MCSSITSTCKSVEVHAFSGMQPAANLLAAIGALGIFVAAFLAFLVAFAVIGKTFRMRSFVSVKILSIYSLIAAILVLGIANEVPYFLSLGQKPGHSFALQKKTVLLNVGKQATIRFDMDCTSSIFGLVGCFATPYAVCTASSSSVVSVAEAPYSKIGNYEYGCAVYARKVGKTSVELFDPVTADKVFVNILVK